MIARKVCLFCRNSFISAAARPRSMHGHYDRRLRETRHLHRKS
jgi:hypothetical protein